jgi:hypothetical protein
LGGALVDIFRTFFYKILHVLPVCCSNERETVAMSDTATVAMSPV